MSISCATRLHNFLKMNVMFHVAQLMDVPIVRSEWFCYVSSEQKQKVESICVNPEMEGWNCHEKVTDL